jgi:putative spermidine/putrescine transport system ATP-binding protein
MRGVSRSDARGQVTRALGLVQMAGYEARAPGQLSGGQQQRVALARALVFDPKVLLMDEPLGALDRKLREEMQLELKRLQRQLQVTIIYVTHDQDEALSMSDRIVVMNRGCIAQVGTPRELYAAPASAFVADFIGETNFLTGRIEAISAPGRFTVEHASGVRIGGCGSAALRIGQQVVVSLRPEWLALDTGGVGSRPMNACEGRVSEIVYVGDFTKYHVDWGGQRLVAKLQDRLAGTGPAVGDTVTLRWDAEAARLFDAPA